MKVLVLNGSPKGEYSITLQTVRYLEKKFADCQFEVLHVGQRIKALEGDFAQAKVQLEQADVLLFSYPVYTFIAPYQMHRFIELMKEHQVQISGKFASQISTSKHFYDVTAHRYIMENAQDMGMKFVRGLSADMDDLLTEQGRSEAVKFWNYFLWCREHDISEPVLVSRVKQPLVAATMPDVTNGVTQEIVGRDSGAKGVGDACKEVVIVTDCRPENQVLQGMINRFRTVLGIPSRIVNISEYPFRGGCLGCFNCAVSGKCIYIDGFDEFLRQNIQGGSAIVYAFSIKDHSMGATFKLYDDRQFCNGHRTVTMGTPVGYLVDGHYSQEENLRMIVEGRSQVGGNFLAGVATNEQDTDGAIDRMAASLGYALAHQHTQPSNFYGVGGMKIFRDLIYLMQGMMKADHKFYKAHGQYDFPQKKKGMVLKMYLVGMLLSNPKLKSKMGNQMNEGMIAPYRKVLDKE
ncbi:MAG: NAD(P)H-dependent oxidoreductase [Lachnospiraceae bacterium]|nr:NAD(P)H-dependent oxidoreductase [Lachnospiraceae bacterium]